MAAGTPRKKGANGATGRIKAARNARPTTSQTSSTLPEPKSRVRRWAGRSGRWVALVFCFLVAVLLVAPNLFYQPPKYLVAQTPDQDLEAIVTFAVTDEEALQAGRDEINSRSEFYYRYQKSTAAQIRRQQEDLFRHARELVQAPPDSPPADHSSTLAEWVREEQGREIETDLARRVLERSDDLNIQQTFEEAVRDLYQNRGIVENLERYSEQDNAGRVHVSGSPDALLIKPPFMLAIDDVGRFIAEKYGDTNEIQILRASDRSFICDLAQAYVRPNILYQPDTTEATRERKLEKLRKDPPKREFEKGQILVDQGERLTRQDLDLLLAMYEAYGRTLYRRLLAVAVYVALLCGLVFYYMREFRDDLHLSTSNVFLVALPILLALALGRIALGIVSPASTAGYLFPAGLIGMLAVILLGTRSGILLVTIGALAFSISTNLDYKIFLTALLGGYAAVTGLKNARERKEVLKAGLVVGAVNAITILLINYIDDPISPKLALMFWGLANGLACGVIALSVLVPFERLFGVVTDIRLLELTGLDHPLLKNLEEKAPGSFQHCLNVCKLAEAAAKAIGANYLLVRAGAYYHDIGKTLKPNYFGENQISLDEKSLHSKISPYMSAMIIKNHVKAGIELARQHRLPERVIEFIPQHHGTTKISFFYNEAVKRWENSQSTDPVREEDFRYPGPKPQNMETAIVMLSDAVEATVTSRFTSLSINEDELLMTVKKCIRDRFNDGQFDECDLTLRDLHAIEQTFVKTLLGRFHQRIAYPTAPALSGPAAQPARRDRMERTPDTAKTLENQPAHAGKA